MLQITGEGGGVHKYPPPQYSEGARGGGGIPYNHRRKRGGGGAEGGKKTAYDTKNGHIQRPIRDVPDRSRSCGSGDSGPSD